MKKIKKRDYNLEFQPQELLTMVEAHGKVTFRYNNNYYICKKINQGSKDDA